MEIYMKKKQRTCKSIYTKQQRTNIANKHYARCRNKKFIDAQVAFYLKTTLTAVENILLMSRTVAAVHEYVVTDQIDEADLDYFCASVGLSKNSSTFRKYVCIGKRYDMFKKYIKHLPSSYTTLYEITTAPPELFESVMKSGEIHELISLRDVKVLLQKAPNNLSQSKQKIHSAPITLKFDEQKLPNDVKKLIADFYQQLRFISEIEVDITSAKFLNLEIE